MTHIKFKFKIPYDAISEDHFQTNMRLSIKKKKKKKKKETLKLKTYFPIKIHTRSDYRSFSVPSNTQIGLALQQKP